MKEWENFSLVRLQNLREDRELFNFQQYAIFQCLSNDKFCCSLQTGLGKTVCSYATYFYYLTKYPNTKLLIVAPKNVLFQFEKELHKFFNYDEKTLIVHEEMDFMGADKYKDARKIAYDTFLEDDSIKIMYMGYRIFQKDFDFIFPVLRKLKEKKKYNLFVVYDEATAFKNLQTQTFKAVRKVSKISDRSLALTATLTKGKLEEIYAIFKAIGIQITSNKRQFLDNFCVIFKFPNKFAWKITGYKNLEMFSELIKPYSIILRKEDVIEELPPFTLRKIYLDKSSEQVSLIDDIEEGKFFEFDPYEDGKEYDEDFDEEIIRALTQVGHIKRSLIDPRLVTKDNLDDVKYLSPKTEEIIRLLSEEFTDEKIIIYSPSRVYLEILETTLNKSKEVPKFYKPVLKIHGGVRGLEREKNRNLFQESPKHNILITNILESLNLQSSNTIIVTSLPYTGGDLVQLAGRISRIDSAHSNLYLIYLLMNESQDEDEYKIINEQLFLMSTVLGESEKGLIDWDVLTSDNLSGNISKEEYINKSIARILLSKRKTKKKRKI